MPRFNKHIIVTGSARSGTSWLSEVIARQFRYRMLFEPEHEFNTEKGILVADQWIESKHNSKEAHKYLIKVFSNRVDSDWIGQISNRKLKMHLWPFLPKKYIIKFVRANLAAKYMNETFKIPVIHIIRNPYDVLASQQRVRFSWLYELGHFCNQEKLVLTVKEKFNFNLMETTTFFPLEKLTVRWCLENVLPLQVWEPYRYKHQIVRHEDLRNDLRLFLELSETFGIAPIKNIEKEYVRPSSKTHPKSTIMNKDSKEMQFSAVEIKQINRILDIFDCKLYPRKQI